MPCVSLHSCLPDPDSMFGWHNGEVWDLGYSRPGALPQPGPHVLPWSTGRHRCLRHHQRSESPPPIWSLVLLMLILSGMLFRTSIPNSCYQSVPHYGGFSMLKTRASFMYSNNHMVCYHRLKRKTVVCFGDVYCLKQNMIKKKRKGAEWFWGIMLWSLQLTDLQFPKMSEKVQWPEVACKVPVVTSKDLPLSSCFSILCSGLLYNMECNMACNQSEGYGSKAFYFLFEPIWVMDMINW